MIFLIWICKYHWNGEMGEIAQHFVLCFYLGAFLKRHNTSVFLCFLLWKFVTVSARYYSVQKSWNLKMSNFEVTNYFGLYLKTFPGDFSPVFPRWVTYLCFHNLQLQARLRHKNCLQICKFLLKSIQFLMVFFFPWKSSFIPDDYRVATPSVYDGNPCFDVLSKRSFCFSQIWRKSFQTRKIASKSVH